MVQNRPSTPIKRIFISCVLGMILVILASTLFAVAHNNILGSDAYTHDELKAAYARSKAWMLNNKQALYREHNPALWWLLNKANRVTGDGELEHLTQRYLQTERARYVPSPWSALLYEQPTQLDATHRAFASLPPYNIQFVFASQCNAALRNTRPVEQLYDARQCAYSLEPACPTHQMMAYLMLQDAQCKLIENLDSKIETLTGIIVTHQKLDFRVVDVYLQRVMTLIMAGATEQLDKRWVRRVLDQQNDDGGWSNFQALVPWTGNRHLGFSNTVLSVRKTTSNFHATVQGLLISAALLHAH